MKFSVLFSKLSQIARSHEILESIRMRSVTNNAQNKSDSSEIFKEVTEILGTEYTPFFKRSQKEKGQS